MKTADPFYKSGAWVRCREQALIRDNYLCQSCLRAGKLTTANTVHHIKPRREYSELELTLSNLESICPTCHNKEHTEKGNNKRPVSKKIKLVEEKGNPEMI
ncbi:HNH endonuclease [Alteribacillus persepolensis]|nr:HNH endonuclease signature motif containing protein [Alteribacillus persepolensis]